MLTYTEREYPTRVPEITVIAGASPVRLRGHVPTTPAQCLCGRFVAVDDCAPGWGACQVCPTCMGQDVIAGGCAKYGCVYPAEGQPCSYCHAGSGPATVRPLLPCELAPRGTA